MASLSQKIHEWTQQKLLTPEQARAVLEYEQRTRAGSSWLYTALTVLGAGVMALGVIFWVAAHWERIPDALKLGADGCVLTGVGIAAWYYQRAQKPVVYEGLLMGFSGLCMASIGLIGQIFQSGRPLHEAFLFWSAITFGVALCSRKAYLPVLWLGITQLGLVMFSSDHHILRKLFMQWPTAALGILACVWSIVWVVLAMHAAAHPFTRAWKSYHWMWAVCFFIFSESRNHTSEVTRAVFWSYYGVSALGYAILVYLLYRFKEMPYSVKLLNVVLVVLSFVKTSMVGHLHHNSLALLLLSCMFLFVSSLVFSLYEKKSWVYACLGWIVLYCVFFIAKNLTHTAVAYVFMGLTLLVSVVVWKKYGHKIIGTVKKVGL